MDCHSEAWITKKCVNLSYWSIACITEKCVKPTSYYDIFIEVERTFYSLIFLKSISYYAYGDWRLRIED